MSNNKPLSYEGSKTVLQYFEANLRFQLSSRCPSLWKTERVVPLYIDQLIFKRYDYFETSINSEQYNICLNRQDAPRVQFFLWHQDENENVGVDLDINEFGFVDTSNVILPGDLVFVGPEGEEEDEMDWFMDGLHNHQRRYVEGPDQMTIESSDGSKKRYRFRGEIYEAEKCLYNLLFGNRKCPIIVGKLEMRFCSGVLRLPIGIKLKVRELSCRASQIDTLHKIVDNSSSPLHSLEIYKTQFGNRHVQLPFVQDAQKLIVGEVNDMQLLLSLKNQKLHVNFPFMPTEDYFNLIRIWRIRPRSIGTCFTFGHIADFPYPKITSLIQKKFNGKRVGERLVEIPVDEASKILVSYESVEWGEVELILKFEMVAV